MDTSQQQQIVKDEGQDGLSTVSNDQDNCRVGGPGAEMVHTGGLVGRDPHQLYAEMDSRPGVDMQHFQLPGQQDGREFEACHQGVLHQGGVQPEMQEAVPQSMQCVNQIVQHPAAQEGGQLQNTQQEDAVLQEAVQRQHPAGQTQEIPQDPLFNSSAFGGDAVSATGNTLSQAMHNLSHDSGVLSAEQARTPVLVTRSSFAKGSKGPLVCHVQGCSRDLSQEKKYYMRYRVCMEHLKMNAIYVDGELARFCQQCGRFHELSKFDGLKRNCRDRLSQHNRRRRKSKWESMAGVNDGSWNGTPGTPDVKVPRGPRSKRQSQGVERHRGAGGFWDEPDGQAGIGPQDNVDVSLGDKGQNLSAMVQGPYAVGQPSTSVLGTVEGIPVTQGFRRAPAQLGGSRSAFKQFADGNVHVPHMDVARGTESIYEMLVHQHQLQPNQAQQALVHMGQPNLTGRGPDGVAVDGMDRPNSAHLSGIPQMPMLIIPAASAAEIMQQLRGSAVALIPTSGQHGGVPLPIQPSQTGSKPSGIPASLQWTPQMPIPSADLSGPPGLQLAPGHVPGIACTPNLNPTSLSPSSAGVDPSVWGAQPISTSVLAAPPLRVAANPSSGPLTDNSLENNHVGFEQNHIPQSLSIPDPSQGPTFGVRLSDSQGEGMNEKIETRTSEEQAIRSMDNAPMSIDMDGTTASHQLATSFSPGQQVLSRVVLPQHSGLPNPGQGGSDRFFDLQKLINGEGLSEPLSEHHEQSLTGIGNDIVGTPAVGFSSFVAQNDSLVPHPQTAVARQETSSNHDVPLQGGVIGHMSMDSTIPHPKKLQVLSSSLEHNQMEVWGSEPSRPASEIHHISANADVINPSEST